MDGECSVIQVDGDALTVKMERVIGSQAKTICSLECAVEMLSEENDQLRATVAALQAQPPLLEDLALDSTG